MDISMPSAFEVVAMAASAGGPDALRHVLGELPAGLPVPVLVVQHLDPHHDTVLADVLGRSSRLPVRLVHGGERIEPGTVYLARPDYHLLVGPGRELSLSRGELVNYVRPSADVLFESVSDVYGPHALACVLTGTGRDGAAGVAAVKARGGTVIVQDPAHARFDGMPTAAIATGTADFVLALDEIAEVVVHLCRVRAR